LRRLSEEIGLYLRTALDSHLTLRPHGCAPLTNVAYAYG